MKAVILMAGKGERLHPITNTRPKALIPLGNIPLIDHVIMSLEGMVDEFVFVINYKQDMIRDYVTQFHPDLHVRYVVQKDVNGTATAVMSAQYIKEPFVCLNGDVFVERDCIKNAIGVFKKTGNQVISVKNMDNDGSYGSVVERYGKLDNIFEKTGLSKKSLVNIGVYVFKPDIFSAIRDTPLSVRGEYELTDSILIQKEDFAVVKYSGYWNDIGYPWSLLDVNEYIIKNQEERIEGIIEKNVTYSGNIHVGKGTIIRNGAYIIGPVRIGEHCDIGPNCFIRPFTTVGNNCHIGNATEIKNSVLFDNTNAAHLSYVGDSVIGLNCNIGAGTLIANLRHKKDPVKMEIRGKIISSGRRKLGAVIGDNTKTGINVTIYEGRKIGNDCGIGPGVIVEKNVMPWTIVQVKQECTCSSFRKDES
ncbi:MAG: bifunctional sugar-1-phosphate nucleotidylyltransferase/acetyltransferase [Candidatus Methanofastidiosia archaeon]